ncbi:hypothetical protein DRF60_07900 [Chryseobacterium elymi]|uniref:C1q domain-containing protein n=1 Tax=Chryseobacterium elymi TaxID=395936 RepID=A0A3D9DMY6_9FLAO|nr:hypothetical protein [Chryseobacterium elymi]REC79201.1 hypothetical protein DRF60_07900 [Chryseobacterium elymi]
MKKYVIALSAFTSSLVFSQVGINTENPHATLDVSSSASDPTKTDGIIAPRLTGNELKAKDRLYTSQLQGAIIYATSAANPTTIKTVNVTQEGYYYFDGNIWIRFSSESPVGSGDDISIYKDNGSLTGNRNANLNGFNLAFTGTGNFGIGTTANPVEKLEVVGDSRIKGKVVIGSSSTNSKNAALAVRNIDSTEPIVRFTNVNGFRQFSVTDAGNVGIGLGTIEPTETLDASGNVRFRNVPLETAIDTTDRIMVLRSDGTGKKVSSSTLRSEIDTNTNIYTNNGSLSGDRTVTLGGNNLNFAGNGSVGIGVATPTQKLDIAGTARLRNVPNGNVDDNKILVIDNDGIVKKSSLPPASSFVLYDTTGNTVTHSTDNTHRPLAFQGEPDRIYTDYIEKLNNTTYRVKKRGVYTVDLVTIFEDIAIGDNGTVGCITALKTGNKSLNRIGDRWNGGSGTTSITRSVILDSGAEIRVSTACLKPGNTTYKTSSGSTIFITYMPL